MKGAYLFVLVATALLSLAAVFGAWCAFAFTVFRLITGYPA